MRSVDVLCLQRVSAADKARITILDPAIRLTDAGGWFDGEIRETWPLFTTSRYIGRNATGEGTREERDRLLAAAEVILGGFPFPLDLRARAPRLKWFHQRPAGASNLLIGDLWGSDVIATTSRGEANSLPIAEYAIASILHLAKGFNRVALERAAGQFDHRAYRPLLLEGKTALVVGAGGIGQEVGRLCAVLGIAGGRHAAQRRRCAQHRRAFSEMGEAGDLDPAAAAAATSSRSAASGRRRRRGCSTKRASRR